MRDRAWLVASLLLCAICVYAQHGRRGATGSGVSAPPLKGITITTHGVLKQLAKKEIMIHTDEDQIMTFRRSGKTKFLRDGREAKPTDFDLESIVTVDAVEDNDLKLLAIAVRADSSQKKELPAGAR